jgi:hypothetical protein
MGSRALPRFSPRCTEEHPLDYATFEGVIPEGQDLGGAMSERATHANPWSAASRCTSSRERLPGCRQVCLKGHGHLIHNFGLLNPKRRASGSGDKSGTQMKSGTGTKIRCDPEDA